jgi:hypothetical protein
LNISSAAALSVHVEVCFCAPHRLRAAKVRRLILEATMQTQSQTHATPEFTIPHKPHRLVASDRVEGTAVRRSGDDERLHGTHSFLATTFILCRL